MKNAIVVMKPIILVLTLMFVVTNAEVCYKPRITDSILQCDGFKNDFLNCDGLVIGSAKGEEGEDATKIGGELKILEELDSEVEIEIDVWKVLDVGDEYMYNTRAKFCDTLENTDTPWYPLLQSLNISSCPVAPELFEIDELIISLDAVKDVMCHDFCGEYRVELSMVKVTDKLSCHVIELAIAEVEEEDC